MNRRVSRELSPEEADKKTRYLYWWLLVVLFFEYARPASYFPPLGLIPLNSMLPLLLLVVSSFASGLRPWGKIFEDSLAKWPFLFFGMVMASLSWATVTTRAYNVFILLLGYLFLFILIARIVTTRERLRGVFLTLIIAHLFLLLMNPAVVTNPEIRHYISGATFLGDGNDYSLSLCILLGFALELAYAQNSKFKKTVYWSILGILILAIVGTQSRGATLGMVAAFGYLWWRSPRKIIGVVAIGVAAIGVLIYAPDVYFQRLSTLSAPQEESSAEGRIQAWKAGTRMAMDNVLGVGAGNFPNNFPIYRSEDAPVRWMTAHSMYFLILGELGIIGLLLLLKLVFGNVVANIKLRNRIVGLDEDAIQRHAQDIRTLNNTSGSVIGFAVSGAFLSVAYYPHTFVLVALLVATRLMIAESTGLNLVAERDSKRVGRRMGRGKAISEPGPAESVR